MACAMGSYCATFCSLPVTPRPSTRVFDRKNEFGQQAVNSITEKVTLTLFILFIALFIVMYRFLGLFHARGSVAPLAENTFVRTLPLSPLGRAATHLVVPPQVVHAVLSAIPRLVAVGTSTLVAEHVRNEVVQVLKVEAPRVTVRAWDSAVSPKVRHDLGKAAGLERCLDVASRDPLILRFRICRLR